MKIKNIRLTNVKIVATGSDDEYEKCPHCGYRIKKIEKKKKCPNCKEPL